MAKKNPTEEFGILIAIFIGILALLPGTLPIFTYDLLVRSSLLVIFFWMSLILIQITYHSAFFYSKFMAKNYQKFLDVCIFVTLAVIAFNIAAYGTGILIYTDVIW